MEILRIDWGTGRMDLVVKKFFPCPLQVARKIAPLINRYCAAATKAELLSELRDMVEYYQMELQGYKNIISEYKSRGSITEPELRDMKSYEIKVRKTETLKKRVEKNIDLIEGRKK